MDTATSTSHQPGASRSSIPAPTFSASTLGNGSLFAWVEASLPTRHPMWGCVDAAYIGGNWCANSTGTAYSDAVRWIDYTDTGITWDEECGAPDEEPFGLATLAMIVAGF